MALSRAEIFPNVGKKTISGIGRKDQEIREKVEEGESQKIREEYERSKKKKYERSEIGPIDTI